MKLRFTILYFLLLFFVPFFSQSQQSPAKKATGSSKTGQYKKPVTKIPSSKSYTSQGKSSTNNNPGRATIKKSDLTGIWRGYFAQNSFGYYEDRYKFEVQIEQLSNDAVKGVTYSYKTTVFYGKATLQGIYTTTTKNLIIKEVNLVEVKIADQAEPCLMTCYLDYDKLGNLETLSGSYTSQNLKNKGNCGSGKVYLEKTTTTDFYKEDFIIRKEQEAKKPNNLVKKPQPSLSNQATTKKLPLKSSTRKPGASSPLDNIAENTPKVKPGAEENLVPRKNDVITEPPVSSGPSIRDIPKADIGEKQLSKPPVLKNRTNELVKKIYTAAKEITIDLYDNGEVDGDIISVYHNNELIVSHKKLTDKPITFTVKIDESSPLHEFTMVAENLGSIPPNTALMIIKAGQKRYELFIESTEKKNAIVLLEYKPD